MATPTNSEAIKEAVRSYYRKAAETAQNSNCCGRNSGSCCSGDSTTAFYGTETFTVIPVEATRSSRGCGNPVALASLNPGEIVLDLGSGGGLDVLLAAQRVGPQGFVYGLDMTHEMLSLARRNAEKVGATNVAFLKGDIERIPLSDSSVDIIISNCVINLAPDKGHTLHESLRVLRPGGRLAVSDIVIDGTLDDLPLGEEHIRAALSWAGCLAGALTADQYRQLLKQAGFREIVIEVQHRYSFNELLPVPEILASLGPETLQNLASRFTSSAITARRPVKT